MTTFLFGGVVLLFREVSDSSGASPSITMLELLVGDDVRFSWNVEEEKFVVLFAVVSVNVVVSFSKGKSVTMSKSVS